MIWFRGYQENSARKIPTHLTFPCWIPPGKFPPGIFPPTFLNIPTRFFKFFDYCHRYHWYYLKNCFVILCFKSQTYCGVKKKELAGQYCYILKKVLLVKYDNRSLLYPPVCFGTFYLGSWGMWCYSIRSNEFKQFFSIGLLINWLTYWFIYRSENNC